VYGLFRLGSTPGRIDDGLHPALFDPTSDPNVALTCRMQLYTIRLRIICGLLRFGSDSGMGFGLGFRVPAWFPCSVRVPARFPCSVRVPSVFRPCSVRVPSVFRPGFRVPSVFRPCSVRVPGYVWGLISKARAPEIGLAGFVGPLRSRGRART
jgi:hypothetical protein